MLCLIHREDTVIGRQNVQLSGEHHAGQPIFKNGQKLHRVVARPIPSESYAIL